MDQILTVLLTTEMFVGGCLAFILDNTVPGIGPVLGGEAQNQARLFCTTDGLGPEERWPGLMPHRPAPAGTDGLAECPLAGGENLRHDIFPGLVVRRSGEFLTNSL